MAAVLAVWVVTALVVWSDVVVDWTDDPCADRPCPAEAAASVTEAKATDRLSRVLILASASAVTVTIASGVIRARRGEARAAETGRRMLRGDFDRAATALASASPTSAIVLLGQLVRAADAEPHLDDELGEVVSTSVRNWDRHRRAANVHDAWEPTWRAVALLASRPRPVPVDLSGVDLDGLELAPGSRLADAVLQDAVLTDARLGGVDLTRADLSGARLTGADLTGADLFSALLVRAEIAVARLEGTKLGAVRASGADLDRSLLRGADLCLADLTGASLLRADLRDVSANRVDLTRARLHRADLTGADLSDARLEEADLRHATLTAADLRNASLVSADLDGADLRGADLRGADLGGASLRAIRHDDTTRWPDGWLDRPATPATPATGTADRDDRDDREPNAFWDRYATTTDAASTDVGAGPTVDDDGAAGRR